MSRLIENYIRRIEKLVSERPTVPLVGTNHVDDNWIQTDIYPGELSINLESGSLHSSNGIAIIDLNKENMILSGMVVTKNTSGLNKLTISSGHVRINGKQYYHTSATGSGTDILLPFNYGTNNSLFFIYAEPSDAIADGQTTAAGNLKAQFNYVSATGLMNEPTLTEPPSGGLFSTISLTANYPALPDNSVLLGVVLMYTGGIGYDLLPKSVANVGDYYPRFSLSASEFLRQDISKVSSYSPQKLYFPGEFIIHNSTNSIYLSKQIFISATAGISTDIATGCLAPINVGSTGASGYMTSSNVGVGSGVYKTTVGTTFQFRSLTSSYPVQITDLADEIRFSIDTSSILMGATNIGSGTQIYRNTASNIIRLRTILGGTNVNVVQGTNEITISVPNIGTTAQGINLGSGLTVYAGMSGKDLTFKDISLTGGLTSSVSSNNIVISGEYFARGGNNLGGPSVIYAGITGATMQFYGLSAGSGVTIELSNNAYVISATSSGGGSVSGGLNIGTTGATIYAGMSGTDLTFRNIVASTGIEVLTVDGDIVISTTITNGSQGPQGSSGTSGTNGTNGSQGSQGPIGLQGSTGADSTVQGPQGFQGYGYQGPQGLIGSQGSMGPQGTPIPAKVIDVWDNTGGQVVTNPIPSQKSWSAERSNSYPLGLTAIGTTSIQILEEGWYEFVYNLTFNISFGVPGKFYLYEESLQRVDGSDIWASNPGGIASPVTTTGKVILWCEVGSIWSIMCESTNSGSMTAVSDASSFKISKLEIGIGPQGPSMDGPQGAAGAQGGAGPTGSNVILTSAPLTGNGSTGSEATLMYNAGDFTLDAFHSLYLNLDYTSLVQPTISRLWKIYKNDGITPLPTNTIGGYGTIGHLNTSSSIQVPIGCIVNYGGTATIPASGTGEAFPTGVTGSWTIGLTGPTSSFVSGTVSSNSSYSIQLSKPSNGLGISGTITDMATWRVTRASGTDLKIASDSVSFQNVFYWGTCGSFGSGNISQVQADGLTAGDIESLINYRFGGKAQTISSITDSVGFRFVIAYPASLGSLSSIIMDGAAPIIGAFWEASFPIPIYTLSGNIVNYKAYIAVADNSYSANQITTI